MCENFQVRLRPSRRIIMTLSHDGCVEITVAHLTKRDEGTYTCVATNEVGKAQLSIEVVIETTPQEEHTNKLVSSEENAQKLLP